ncbi:hypothetical protein HUS23_10230 [Ectothiorhodospiraceae bacterium 2226]|nr:hypothetical protein HUS23_10230 [Ectothiorhodospiraceae bacterium 2226]
MRMLHILVILALAFGAPLQSAVAGAIVCEVQPPAATQSAAHGAHDHHAHAHGDDRPSMGHEPHAHHDHGALADTEPAGHVCTGACDGVACGSLCCPCAQSGALLAVATADTPSHSGFEPMPAHSAAGRTVGAELRPPKTLHS